MLNFIGSRRLLGVVRLIASGGIGAFSLSLLASGRLPVSTEQSSFAILFIQWEALALTIAKVGGDQLIFAVVSADPSQRVELHPLIKRVVLPLSILAGLLAALAFGPTAGGSMAAAPLPRFMKT